MSPSGSDNVSQQQSTSDVRDADASRPNVDPDPFELFEGTHSESGASDAPGRGSRNSSENSERLDRLEGLLEGLAKQLRQFIANQAKLQQQMQQRTEMSHSSPFENTFSGSSAFTDFLKARDRRMRVGSLDESMPTATAAVPTPVTMTRPVEPVAASQQHQMQQEKMAVPPVEHFAPPTNFGVKIPKPRDLDWSGFATVSGKEVYPGLGADFKAWGLRFLQRLGAAQPMSGGDRPGEFRILALNGILDGSALVYFERMLPLWTAESPTLEHVMNRMLVTFMTTISAAKGLQLMTAEKQKTRTGTDHYQYITYVAERSGCSDLHVLQSLCKSAPSYLQSAMLTRLTSQRVYYLQQATELVSFAIEYEETMNKQDNVPEDDTTWILDSGSSVHLVKNEKLLRNAVNCDEQYIAASGIYFRVNKKGTVVLRTIVDGNEVVVDLTDVYYGESLPDNIISYGILEEKGVF
ncbi:hypothetical protein PHMEG_00022260 [Phytophthora megakarya]|uniref:Retrovirus-related Pol polyprotein from transposon TNT 1-94-like beta-barrel domain-containing protein n=1 Tax=Phytophthora megakarya TaxID=4795 RepID=A0A225VJ72_9STRA|nr:hypothetical protein PHMEG_00022260 [Phytophthora megakarya]